MIRVQLSPEKIAKVKHATITYAGKGQWFVEVSDGRHRLCSSQESASKYAADAVK